MPGTVAKPVGPTRVVDGEGRHIEEFGIARHEEVVKCEGVMNFGGTSNVAIEFFDCGDVVEINGLIDIDIPTTANAKEIIGEGFNVYF